MQQPHFSIGLTFRRARSARYGAAVRLAKGFESYCEDEDGDLLHNVFLTDALKQPEVFSRFVTLVKIVADWKDTVLTMSGKVMPPAAVELLSSVGECYQRQKRSGNPYHYCNGFDPRHSPTHFGCRLLSSVNRFIPHNGDIHQSDRAWYRIGELDGTVFTVDKAKIIDMLEEEATHKYTDACPVFRRELVKEEVQSLPDTVETAGNAKWLIEQRADGTRGIRLRTIADARKLAKDGSRIVPYSQVPEGQGAWGQPATRTIPSVRFDDVGGQDKAVSDIRDWVELPLRHPELFQHVGVPTQVGVILFGPPGTGKTLLAQAVAGECEAHLEMVSGPEILSRWVGQSEEAIRIIFERARSMAPSVVLLDEIDAIAPARDKTYHGHEITLVSQLLAVMDGLYERGQVVVIATTNRLEAVDPALRRPGRFDYAVEMGLPDLQGREAIFQRHIRRMAVGEVNIRELAERTPGMSGADIAKICRQAGLLCAKEAIAKGYDEVADVIVEARHFMAALGETGTGTPVPDAGSATRFGRSKRRTRDHGEA